jgi:hypothetical protein
LEATVLSIYLHEEKRTFICTFDLHFRLIIQSFLSVKFQQISGTSDLLMSAYFWRQQVSGFLVPAYFWCQLTSGASLLLVPAYFRYQPIPDVNTSLISSIS